jgi:thiosulfate/3-mercaptopyruvate sulfurtransferase
MNETGLPDGLPGPLVDVSWLARRLDSPGHEAVVVVDAGVGKQRHAEQGIPGARVFDIDGALSDPDSPLPHTMPAPERFQREMRALGVNDSSTVIAYDGTGIYSSARAWWMLRAMGFDRAAVLDGGLPAWIAAGQPCRPLAREGAWSGDFTARPRPGLLVGADAVAEALGDPGAVVLDARTRDRFAGRVAEPRPGLRGGHMPGAVNLPFGELQEPDGHMLPVAELRSRLADAADGRERMVFSCGSGVTACNLALGAALAGYRDLAVYDGSWSEWGLPSSGRPVDADASPGTAATGAV